MYVNVFPSCFLTLSSWALFWRCITWRVMNVFRFDTCVSLPGPGKLSAHVSAHSASAHLWVNPFSLGSSLPRMTHGAGLPQCSQSLSFCFTKREATAATVTPQTLSDYMTNVWSLWTDRTQCDILTRSCRVFSQPRVGEWQHESLAHLETWPRSSAGLRAAQG